MVVLIQEICSASYLTSVNILVQSKRGFATREIWICIGIFRSLHCEKRHIARLGRRPEEPSLRVNEQRTDAKLEFICAKR